MAANSPLAEHDAVKLLQPFGRWPAGTAGAVVSLVDGVVLVEIVDTNGRTRDLLTLSPDRLTRSSA